MVAESGYFFGWLSDDDRRIIRGLRDPKSENIDEVELPEVVTRVGQLLGDYRNVSLIAGQMPEEYLYFCHQVLSRKRGASDRFMVRAFMRLHWLSIARKFYQGAA